MEATFSIFSAPASLSKLWSTLLSQIYSRKVNKEIDDLGSLETASPTFIPKQVIQLLNEFVCTAQIKNEKDTVRISKIGRDKTHILFLSSCVPKLKLIVVSVESHSFSKEVNTDSWLDDEEELPAP